MKKRLLILLIISLLFGCKIDTSYKDISGIVEVTYAEISALMDSDVSFILYIGRDDCGDCIEFYPIFEDYINTHYDTGIYYLNIREMRDNARKEDASEEEKAFFDEIYETFEIEWTPTIEWIQNGKIYKKYQYLDEDYIKIKDREQQKLKREEFIEEFEQFMDEYYKEANNEEVS